MKTLGLMIGIVVVAVISLFVGYDVGHDIGLKEAEVQGIAEPGVQPEPLAPCDAINPILATWIIDGDSVKYWKVEWCSAFRYVGNWPTDIEKHDVTDMFETKTEAVAELCRRMKARRDSLDRKLKAECGK